MADMKTVKKKFYEGMQEMKPKGLLFWFFTRFRKFERHRTSKAFDLLPSGEKFLGVGCNDGSLVRRAKEKFN